MIKLGDRVLPTNDTLVMGIINLTPDSFYPSSRTQRIDEVLLRTETMISEGADIIDYGAVSTRPGSRAPSIMEEIDRLIGPLLAVRAAYPDLVISLDTYRSDVLRSCIDAQIDIVNDIGAGRFDDQLLDIVAQNKLTYVLMHSSGLPETMQDRTDYTNILMDIIQFFSINLRSLKNKGISNVLIDPGFGFGKTIDQNFTLLYHLSAFKLFELPIMLGFSRKSMIYKSLNITPELALNGTTALHMVALQNGAKVLRVHDVKEAKEVIALYKRLTNTAKA